MVYYYFTFIILIVLSHISHAFNFVSVASLGRACLQAMLSLNGNVEKGRGIAAFSGRPVTMIP